MLTFHIVGAHFRPPAKLLLEHLLAGTPLTLRAEPTNPYDENAIKVELAPEFLPPEESDFWSLCETIYDIERAELVEGPIHLGYIPRVDTGEVHPLLWEGTSPGTLTFTASGKPAIILA